MTLREELVDISKRTQEKAHEDEENLSHVIATNLAGVWSALYAIADRIDAEA